MHADAQLQVRSMVEMAMSYVVETDSSSIGNNGADQEANDVNALADQLFQNLDLNGNNTIVTAASAVGTVTSEEVWDGKSFSQKLADLGKVLSNNVTRVTLACKPPADTATVIGMIAPLADSCFQLAGFISTIPLEIVGKTYYQEIQKTANEIFLGVAALLNEFLDNPVQEMVAKVEKGYLIRTGIVWEACQVFEKISVDNRQAVGKEWKELGLMLEDAISEVQEAIENGGSKKDNDEDDDEEDDEDSDMEDDDSWNESTPMTEQEKQVATKCHALLKLTRMLFKKLQQRCLDIAPSSSSSSATGSIPPPPPSLQAKMWDLLYFRGKEIGVMADEVASSLYSPQDLNGLSSLLKELNRRNLDCLKVGRWFVKGQVEQEKWLDMCELQLKKLVDAVLEPQPDH